MINMRDDYGPFIYFGVLALSLIIGFFLVRDARKKTTETESSQDEKPLR